MGNNLIKSYAQTNDVASTQVGEGFLEFNTPKSEKMDNNFKSIEAFKNDQKNNQKTSIGGVSQNTEYTAWFRFHIQFEGLVGVIIYVRQKITPVYEILDVTSSEWGVTFAMSWEQSSYDINQEGQLMLINIYGKMKYNLFIEGIGTVYIELVQFRVAVSNKTGKEISIKRIK